MSQTDVRVRIPVWGTWTEESCSSPVPGKGSDAAWRTLWAMQAVRPHMKAQGWGRIVNFASAAGITGMAGYAAYNASKEAIRALTRTAAREWGRDGIVVNAIAPGAASKRGLESAARDEAEYREFLRDHPMGRQGDP